MREKTERTARARARHALAHAKHNPQVKTHNIISFYDNNDKSGKNFNADYGGKTIRLTRGGKTFDAIIADTCGNDDCENCCRNNAAETRSRFLIDIEKWTLRNHFGDKVGLNAFLPLASQTPLTLGDQLGHRDR